MREERITVYVNGRPVRIFRGFTVKQALLSLDQALYEAAVRGELFPEDENGHPLGLEGGLAEGARIYTRGGGGGRTGTSG
ncbi:MAG TPA: hypothetical protein PLR43_06765 [Syntrophales bacterium]|nr:hypothetical protein [Syntrophales bacterium]